MMDQTAVNQAVEATILTYSRQSDGNWPVEFKGLNFKSKSEYEVCLQDARAATWPAHDEKEAALKDAAPWRGEPFSFLVSLTADSTHQTVMKDVKTAIDHYFTTHPAPPKVPQPPPESDEV